MEIMRRLVQEEEGQGLVEYVMIVAVVVGIGLAVGGSGVGAIISGKIKTLIGQAPDTGVADPVKK